MTKDDLFQYERPEKSPGFLLWQTNNLWKKKIIESLSDFDLTHVQFVLLAGIAWFEKNGESITQVQLANHAKTDIMMTSKVLRVLEKKEFLFREMHQTDTRAKVVKLTPSGRALIKQAIKAVEEVDQQFFSPLEGQLSDFNQALESLIQESK